MSDRSSDPGLSGNLRRSFLPSRAPTSYHRDQGGRSRWRHLLRLLREERQRRRFCCRPALQRHWRSRPGGCKIERLRSEEHTSELQSLMRISYAVFCLKKQKLLSNLTFTTA